MSIHQKLLHRPYLRGLLWVLFINGRFLDAFADEQLTLENEYYAILVEKASGAISSLVVKENQCELIREKRLISNFRVCLPLPDYQCNYIDGMAQTPKSVSRNGNTISVKFSGMSSAKGEFSIDLSYTISLIDDFVSFKASLTNHCPEPISEFWFPRIGGWTQFGSDRDARLATPDYSTMSRHNVSLFKDYPGSQGLGAEAAEWSSTYPGSGLVMPWWDIYDEQSNTGLYLGYHDPIFRFSTWHTYLMPNRTGDWENWFAPEQAAGLPIGLIFSHVRYPFIHSGETLDSGEFIIRAHKGDWHNGSQFYRDWFMAHFPFDKSDSWLRKKSAWFSSIIYQPEDRIVADYQTYDQWCADAQKHGIDCFELIGWDSGGLERNYPIYQPEEKLGGRSGFRQLLKSIDARGGKCLVFNNYNILDQNTDWYKKERIWPTKALDGLGGKYFIGKKGIECPDSCEIFDHTGN